MTTIPLDNITQKFYQGVSTAAKVTDEHGDVDFPDKQSKRAFFWFYVGVMAHEAGCRTSDEFGAFINGAATRQP